MLAALAAQLGFASADDSKQTMAVALTIVVWFVIVLAATPMIWVLIQPHVRAWLPSERRAVSLLREILSPEELRQLTWLGYVDVPSPSNSNRTYRVPRTRGYVQVLDGGRAVMRLCLQPTERIPDADVVLLHKLMIEANETAYLDKANKFPYRDPH
ncbi:MAG TPA: hypothetical protein VF916_08680 [Ktedonobacterales bacterium]